MTPWCEKVDRLSSLPKKVHLVILSLMPTKYAVRTSILSKRWRYTWTLIHNLDFDDIQSNSYSHVDRVLMLCKTTCVKIFRLHFSRIHVPDSTVSKWISEAVRLNVSELDIHMIRSIGLPLSLFTCNTLSKLRLNISWYSSEYLGDCPPSIYLPNLKTLDIIAINERFDFNIKSISCDNIFKLIHGCPLLEDLSLKIRIRGDTEDFYFKAPTLKRLQLGLTISYYSSTDIRKVILNVPNLEYLRIEENFIKCSLFVIEDLSSLVKAKVSSGVFYNHLCVDLVKGLSKVRNLTIDTASEVIGHAFKNLHFPEFPHVKKLDLVGCDPFTLRKMLRFQILKRFCQLEHLCIKKEKEGRWSEPNSFPTLTFTNMLTVEYTDTTCWEEFNTNFLKFILANAIDLKKLIVRYNSDLVTCKEREQLNAELSMFPRASRNCQIHLAPYN